MWKQFEPTPDFDSIPSPDSLMKGSVLMFISVTERPLSQVSAWTSEGRCESLPAKKRTAREIYRKAKAVPIRKPLYPFDSKTLEKGTEKTDLRRAKTAGILTIPTGESPTKNESKSKPSRVNSSMDNRYRPSTTVGIGLDNNANRTSKRSVGRKSSVSKTTLSSSLDSLKDSNKEVLQNTPLNIDTRRTQFSTRVSKSDKIDQTRPPKGPRRSSMPGMPLSYSSTKPRPNRFSPAVVRTNKSPSNISSRGSSDSDDRDRPSLVDLTDSIVSMKINKPQSRKPANKSNFATSVKELKHIHRSHQPSKRDQIPLETAPLLVTTGSAQKLKKKDAYSP